jgi:hypothetical protein
VANVLRNRSDPEEEGDRKERKKNAGGYVDETGMEPTAGSLGSRRRNPAP